MSNKNLGCPEQEVDPCASTSSTNTGRRRRRWFPRPEGGNAPQPMAQAEPMYPRPYQDRPYDCSPTYTVRSTGPSPVSQTHAFRIGTMPPELLHPPPDVDPTPQRPNPEYEKYLKDPNLYNFRCDYEFPWQTSSQPPTAQVAQVQRNVKSPVQPTVGAVPSNASRTAGALTGSNFQVARPNMPLPGNVKRVYRICNLPPELLHPPPDPVPFRPDAEYEKLMRDPHRFDFRCKTDLSWLQPASIAYNTVPQQVQRNLKPPLQPKMAPPPGITGRPPQTTFKVTRPNVPLPENVKRIYKIQNLPPELLHPPPDTEPFKPDAEYEKLMKDPYRFDFDCDTDLSWLEPASIAYGTVPQQTQRNLKPPIQPTTLCSSIACPGNQKIKRVFRICNVPREIRQPPPLSPDPNPDPEYEKYLKDPNLYNFRVDSRYPWESQTAPPNACDPEQDAGKSPGQPTACNDDRKETNENRALKRLSGIKADVAGTSKIDLNRNDSNFLLSCPNDESQKKKSTGIPKKPNLSPDEIQSLIQCETEDVELIKCVSLDEKKTYKKPCPKQQKAQDRVKYLVYSHETSGPSSSSKDYGPMIDPDPDDISPEVAAAMVFSHEKGIELDSCPNETIKHLFPEEKHPCDKLPESKISVVENKKEKDDLIQKSAGVPSEGVSDSAYTNTIKQKGDENLSRASCELNLNFAKKKTEYVLVSQKPQRINKIQYRGNVPNWSPGYFSAFPDELGIKIVSSPSGLFNKAWTLTNPENLPPSGITVIE